MATSSHATMMRAISAAGDRERTGALDVEWDGSRASLFFMFGHPSHAVFTSTDGRSLAGGEALTALAHELPAAFRVAPWRRAMVTEDTLHLTSDELQALFPAGGAAAATAGLAAPGDEPGSVSVEPDSDANAGSALEETSPGDAAEPPPEPAAAGEGASADAPGFPLLPLGPALWSDDMVNVAGLEAFIPRLPDCLLVLTGEHQQAAALVAAGVLVDAISFAGGSRFVGEEATAALMSAATGVITAHRVDDPRLVVTLPLLWRGARVSELVPQAWHHADELVAEARGSQRTCALVIEAPLTGVVLFHEGDLVAVYSSAEPDPGTSMTLLDSLLQQPGARVTVAGEGLPVPVAFAATVAAEPTTAATAQAETVDVDSEVPEQGMFSIATPPSNGSAPAADAAETESPVLPDFVQPRLDVDFGALRTELSEMAVTWLNADDAVLPATAIAAARPGVADFVSTIAAIGMMKIPGQERAVIRAMAREMHYRASEVLCGV